MITMTEKEVYKGRIYTRDPDSKHLSKRTYYGRKQYNKITKKYSWVILHRKIWEAHFGPIPYDHIIHHKDGNSSNNDVSNLQCVPLKDHLSKFHDGMKYKKVEKVCSFCGSEYMAKTKRSNYCIVCEKQEIQKFYKDFCLLSLEAISKL
jgi:hypothetical protein